jgi:hypothetical protein
VVLNGGNREVVVHPERFGEPVGKTQLFDELKARCRL